MCGIAGFFSGCGFDSFESMRFTLSQMANAIKHRGPDDSGEWIDQSCGFGMAHRRLSVLDLTHSGHQPMESDGGRFVIAFNGEIYNHLELRSKLEKTYCAPSWRGQSDTETLLQCINVWGVRRTLEESSGMFAFAVWDRQERNLILARDRFGEKPLYYGWQRDSFLFGSELKAFRVHPHFVGGIDRGTLSLYLRHNCIPAPYSIHPGIFKLAPGSFLTLGLGERDPVIETYWDSLRVATDSRLHQFQGDSVDAVNTLDELLRDVISSQMMADVPLGAFLSGGVDSSLVVALMQKQSMQPVKTFSIGFNEKDYNEANFAKSVAFHLGTEHTELYVTPEEAMSVIPQLPLLYDEPFADFSQIPTFLVSKLARAHVTVSLSGDAGDELFCGYSRYALADNLWRKLNKIPVSLRCVSTTILSSLSPSTWNALSSPLTAVLPSNFNKDSLGDKFHRLADLLGAKTFNEMYLKLISHVQEPNSIIVGGNIEPHTLLTDPASLLQNFSNIERMMVLDLLTYLTDNNLVKVDRASMGVSLESRIPFLDPRLFRFAWSLPQQYKIRDGVSKWVLREVLYRYVPRKLIERPKMGFSVPMGTWLRGPLRDWAESLLDEKRLRREGYFVSDNIQNKWREHLSGARNWQYHLWDILMFQAWLSEQ